MTTYRKILLSRSFLARKFTRGPYRRVRRAKALPAAFLDYLGR
jgi:hypothetical protein